MNNSNYLQESKSAIRLEISLIKDDIQRIIDSGQVNVEYLALLAKNLENCYTQLDKLEKEE